MEKLSGWRQKMAQFGTMGIAIYLASFVLVFSGFLVAINAGWKTESTAGTAGVIGAAYVATRLTAPLRIGIALVLAPIATRLWNRWRGVKSDA